MEQLVITVGSAQSLELELLDEHDVAESLAGADRASFAVRESLQSTTNLLLRSTQAVPGPATLAFAAGGKLVATMTGSEVLTPGVYVGEAAVRFGSDTAWKYTDPFRVVVVPAGAPQVGA